MGEYVFTESIGFKIELCSRLMLNHFNQRLRQAGCPVTAEQWGIINYLLQQDGLTQNELAQKVEKDHTCVSRLVGNLKKHGLVECRKDPKDRRRKLIRLTEEGRAMQEVAAGQAERNLVQAFAGIDSQGVAEFLQVMDQVIANMRQ